MNKLIIALFACILVLSACGNNAENQGAIDEQAAVTPAEESAENTNREGELAPENDPPEPEEQTIEVDKGLLNTEVTLPASMFKGHIERIIAKAKEDGVNEVTKNGTDRSLIKCRNRFITK